MFRQAKFYQSDEGIAASEKSLVFIIAAIIFVGMIMVASASMPIAINQYHNAFYFVNKQLLFVIAGSICIFLIQKLPMDFWQKLSHLLIFLGLVAAIIVLLPGIGKEINGSQRWLNFGFFSLQVSEFVKLMTIIFLADYLSRREASLREETSTFLKPMVVLAIISLLLLKQPDFGAVTVLMVTALGMLFFAGMRKRHFLLLMLIVMLTLLALAVFSPYRWARLTGFLHPWEHPFGEGYQLTQALIAFGRGGWFGVGLGDSIQKQFYLPEAQTDFIFAVFAEELGLIGVIVLISLYLALIWRGMRIGYRAYQINKHFNAYTALGISLWIALQTLINVGVNTGSLPTKGLTLPLFSYGGSSLFMMMVALGILLRIQKENKKYSK